MADGQVEQIIELLKRIENRLEKIELAVIKNRADSLDDDFDPLIPKGVEVILQHDKASASILQRFLQVGYARAARMLDQMYQLEIIGPGIGAKPRKINTEFAQQFLDGQKVFRKFHKL